MKQETGGYELHNWNDPQGGAHGAMQILLGTAKIYRPNITYQELTKPENNIPLGVRLLSELIVQYKTTDAKVIYAHYNGGGNPPPISFTRGECVKKNTQLFANSLKPALLRTAGFPITMTLISIGILAVAGTIYMLVRAKRRRRKW